MAISRARRRNDRAAYAVSYSETHWRDARVAKPTSIRPSLRSSSISWRELTVSIYKSSDVTR